MSDSIRQELGQIQGILSQIQKNTDKIPDLAATVQQHETTLSEMQPAVADYVRNRQRAIGIGAFIAAVFAAIGRLTGGGH
jgi:hypothetical protein